MELVSDPLTVPINSTIVRSKELQHLRRVLGLAERLSPSLAARMAGAIFRRPRRHSQPDREKTWADTAERIRIPYLAPTGAGRRAPRDLGLLSWGQGPTVLLMHGWEGRASQMGAFAQPLVAAGFRVVALDAPAHGRSGGKTSSMPEFAAGLLCAARVLGPLHGIVGHSLGSAATALALRDGLAVERLAFVSPPYDLDIFFALFIQVLGLRPETQGRMIRGYERQFQVPWDSIRLATATDQHDLPLLVAHDKSDAETPFAGAKAVTAAWPQGRLFATDGLGHRRILRDSRVIQEVTQHMLDR